MKDKEIIFLETARNDLKKIFFYIFEETKEIERAHTLIDSIKEEILYLKNFLQLGIKIKIRLFEYYRITFGKYYIFYTLNDEKIFIERIIHSAQDYEVVIYQ